MYGSTLYVGVGEEIGHISAVLKSLSNANLFPDFSEIAFLLKPCFHPIEEAGYVMFQLFFANFDGFTYNAECI